MSYRPTSRRVRVFKVESRWWWWCPECYGGDCMTPDRGATLSWRYAFDLAKAHVHGRHGLSAREFARAFFADVSEPPC